MPNAGVTSKPRPRRSLRRWRRPASARAAEWEFHSLPRRGRARRPSRRRPWDGEDPFERIRDFQLDVCHRTASWYERRSAACAVASVAETVPTSTSSATAID